MNNNRYWRHPDYPGVIYVFSKDFTPKRDGWTQATKADYLAYCDAAYVAWCEKNGYTPISLDD